MRYVCGWPLFAALRRVISRITATPADHAHESATAAAVRHGVMAATHAAAARIASSLPASQASPCQSAQRIETRLNAASAISAISAALAQRDDGNARRPP